MFTDPLAQQIGVGGAVAIGVTAVVMKFLPAFLMAMKSSRNGNGHAVLSPEAYELMLGRVLKEANKVVIEKLQEINENINQTRRRLQNDVSSQVIALDQSQRRVEQIVASTFSAVSRVETKVDKV
jgi:hypothetical protein